MNGALVGDFVATAYGVGIISALLSPGLIRRYGGVRTTQAVLLAAAGMLVTAASSFGVVGLACAAVVLGSGYGAAAPASTHLLVPHTPRSIFNLVMSLRESYRCIVPDHIGCGLSDKPPLSEYDYSLKSRIDDLEWLLEERGLTKDLTLVLHDWGGMIGMGFAARHPDRVKRIVAMNTGAFSLPSAKKLPRSRMPTC